MPPRTGTRAARQSSKHEPKANRRALFPRNNRRLFALFCLQAVRRKTDAANAATRSQVRSVLNSGFCGPASSHQRCVLCTKAGTDTHKATHKMTRLRLWCLFLMLHDSQAHKATHKMTRLRSKCQKTQRATALFEQPIARTR